MTKIRTYRDLIVWQKAFRLVARVYECCRDFPKHEIYGLLGQVRRAAVSVPSNIAEGTARSTRKEYGHFLDMAMGSLFELQTHLLLAQELKYLSKEAFEGLDDAGREIERMLSAMIRKLRKAGE